MIQDLLNKEAQLSNAGKKKSPERIAILTTIVAMRGNDPPVCHGEDDCSTNALSVCPWRIDCGSKLYD